LGRTKTNGNYNYRPQDKDYSVKLTGNTRGFDFMSKFKQVENVYMRLKELLNYMQLNQLDVEIDDMVINLVQDKSKIANAKKLKEIKAWWLPNSPAVLNYYVDGVSFTCNLSSNRMILYKNYWILREKALDKAKDAVITKLAEDYLKTFIDNG